MARRGRLAGTRIPSLLLDSGGVWATANGNMAAIAAVEVAREQGALVFAPTAVLAEALRGGPEDAPANRVLRQLVPVALDVVLARRAAQLKRAAGVSGVAATIDAIVVATSEAKGGRLIVTSDPHDIRMLADHAGVRIRPVKV